MAGRRGPITPAERKRIIALHGEGKTRNAIAKEAGVSGDTVTKVVRAAGLTFDRTMTLQATEAKKADAAKLRAQLELDLLDDARRLREQLWQPAKAFNFGGKDNTYNETELAEPVFADKLKLVQAATSAINTALRIEAARGEGGVAAARSLVADLAEFFGHTREPAE